MVLIQEIKKLYFTKLRSTESTLASNWPSACVV